MTTENLIFIGKKPTMNYVLAAVTQLNSTEHKVCIKARGKAISKAVDVAEIIRNRFEKQAIVKEIKTNTESLPNEEGQNVNVSSIEIYLEKQV